MQARIFEFQQNDFSGRSGKVQIGCMVSHFHINIKCCTFQYSFNSVYVCAVSANNSLLRNNLCTICERHEYTYHKSSDSCQRSRTVTNISPQLHRFRSSSPIRVNTYSNYRSKYFSTDINLSNSPDRK